MNPSELPDATVWSEVGLIATIVLSLIVLYRLVHMRKARVRALASLPLEDGALISERKEATHV